MVVVVVPSLYARSYAVLGVSVFGKNDPIHMGTLHIAFLTLFRCATLEDWTDVMYIAMQGTWCCAPVQLAKLLCSCGAARL